MTKNPKLDKVLTAMANKIDDVEVLPELDEPNENQLLMYAFRNSSVEIIFKGSIEECRTRFYQDYKKNGFLRKAIYELATFCQRQPQTVRNWISGKSRPQRVDQLRWQYWLRAKGYSIRELDKMPNSFFQLRKHILTGDITFKVAAYKLGFSQEKLATSLNNKVKDRLAKAHTLGKIYSLVVILNRSIAEREIAGLVEVDLDPDGEFSNVKQRYGVGKKSPHSLDDVTKLTHKT